MPSGVPRSADMTDSVGGAATEETRGEQPDERDATDPKELRRREEAERIDLATTQDTYDRVPLHNNNNSKRNHHSRLIHRAITPE